MSHGRAAVTTKDWNEAVVIAIARLRDGEAECECAHCGRSISVLVETDMGIIGRGCAQRIYRMTFADILKRKAQAHKCGGLLP